MKIFRMHLAVAGLVALFASTALQAQNYPTKPVRFVCVTAPGGGLDVVGRIVADRLSRSFGTTWKTNSFR